MVGAGLMGRWHAHAIRRVGSQVAAVVDPISERARALAAEYGAAATCRTLAEALSTEQVDVVHVCTPLDSHERLAREALDAGRHVLIEKPLAPTAEATAELLDLARVRARLLCPVHQFLYQGGVLDAARLLEVIGPIRHLDAVACSAGAEGEGEGGRDRVVGEILPHPLSLFARFLPVSLEAVDWSVCRPLAGELRATASAAGVSASILISMCGRPTVNALRIVAESGTIHVDLFHGFAVLEAGRVSRTRKVLRPLAHSARTLARASRNLAARAARREPAYPGLRELIRRFHSAARCGGLPPISAAESLAVAVARDRLVRAIVEAAASQPFGSPAMEA